MLCSMQRVPDIGPGESASVTVQLLPLVPGAQCIRGLYLAQTSATGVVRKLTEDAAVLEEVFVFDGDAEATPVTVGGRPAEAEAEEKGNDA